MHVLMGPGHIKCLLIINLMTVKFTFHYLNEFKLSPFVWIYEGESDENNQKESIHLFRVGISPLNEMERM